MKPQELETLCNNLTGGNVSKFVDLVGITRTAYYRSLRADVVHELTAHRIQAKLHELAVAPDRLADLERRVAALCRRVEALEAFK